MSQQIKIDMSFALNALYARQTVAMSFGIEINQEFTWDLLERLVLDSDVLRDTPSILVQGRSQLAVRLPKEDTALRALLQKISHLYPDKRILMVLH